MTTATATATPSIAAAEDDIQALVAAGFHTLPQAEYLLLTVTQGRGARQWLRSALQQQLVLPVSGVTRDAPVREVAMVAMSCAGLSAVGVKAAEQRPFPSTFARGMADPLHARVLGDGDPAAWRWGDVAQGAPQTHLAHWLVAHYWHADAAPNPLFSRQVLEAAGFAVQRVAADPAFFGAEGHAVEPFGFRDGIAQPVLRGLRAGRGRQQRRADAAPEPFAADRLIEPGEFVLGYENEYHQLAYAPDAQGWRGQRPAAFTTNASYLAVRQIVQDVKAFEDFEQAHAASRTAPDAPTLGELMLGRKRDGTSLSACPIAQGDADAFRYRMDDLQGFGCPRGAHVRRANPRDTLSHDIRSGIESSKLHRLLRRGRAYREGPEQGLFFMALNADLDRQFSFVQQQWIANAAFGDLRSQGDPLLGASHRAFTVQRNDLAQHVDDLPPFTQVVGGGYFLLPGLTALKFIAG